MDAARFFFADFYNAVGDEAEGYSVRDAVAQRHKQAGEESGDRLLKIFPPDFPESGGHHNAHCHQSRSCGCGRNRADKSGQEGAEGKTDGDHHAGKAGTASCLNAGGALHKRGGVGGAENGADGGGDGVGKQSLVHLGAEAGTGEHGFFILLAENTAAPSRSDKTADGIKGVGNAQGENGNQHQGELSHILEQRGKSPGSKDYSEGRGQGGTGFRKADRTAGSGDAHGDSQQGCKDDADEDSAPHAADQQNDRQYQPDQKQPERRPVQSGDGGNAGFKADNFHIQKTNIGYEHADAAADGILQADGDRFNDIFPQFCHGNQDIDQAAEEHHGKSLLPGKAQGKAHRVHKESV